jgi:hypothetical protein
MRVTNECSTPYTMVLSDKQGQSHSHIVSNLDTDQTETIKKNFSNTVQNLT